MKSATARVMRALATAIPAAVPAMSSLLVKQLNWL